MGGCFRQDDVLSVPLHVSTLEDVNTVGIGVLCGASCLAAAATARLMKQDSAAVVRTGSTLHSRGVCSKPSLSQVFLIYRDGLAVQAGAKQTDKGSAAWAAASQCCKGAWSASQG